MLTWEGGPKCPSGEHELEGPWVKFCHVCQAYVDDMEHYVRVVGVTGLEARHRAQDDYRAGRRPGTEPGPAQLAVLPGDENELEESVRRRCTDFLEQVGFTVYKLEQGYRPDACQACGVGIPIRGSQQTLGLADILVAGSGILFFVEFKRPKRFKGVKRTGFVSNRSPEQLQFERACKAAGVEVYLWRSLEDAQAWFELYRKGVQ